MILDFDGEKNGLSGAEGVLAAPLLITTMSHR